MPRWSYPCDRVRTDTPPGRDLRRNVLEPIDVALIAAYLVLALAWGARHARRAGANTTEFFVAGRSLPWWIAGTSLVATTFAADTPLAIAGLVVTEGISGNWFWWADVLPAMLAAFLIAHLWRRSGVLTDNELVELRYAGAPAAGLRLFRALYFGVLRNAIVIGWVNLAMLKVLQLALGLDASSSGWLLAGLFGLTVGYTLLSGLWGVVFTDALQFVLAMAGSIVLAFMAVADAGGLPQLLDDLRVTLGPESAARTLALIPEQREAFWAFVIYVGCMSWSTGNTEGSGYTAQRLLACRDERHARLAAIWFAVAHFVLRPWPWIVVGLVAYLAYPGLPDPESGYVRALLDNLPAGLRGVMLAAMLAAFMSTVDTQLNWGASYLTNEVWKRFVRPEADERTLVAVARVSIVGLAAVGALATYAMPSISGAWKFLASISAGTGCVNSSSVCISRAGGRRWLERAAGSLRRWAGVPGSRWGARPWASMAFCSASAGCCWAGPCKVWPQQLSGWRRSRGRSSVPLARAALRVRLRRILATERSRAALPGSSAPLPA